MNVDSATHAARNRDADQQAHARAVEARHARNDGDQKVADAKAADARNAQRKLDTRA